MTADAPDDDRTVIRPLGPAARPAAGSAVVTGLAGAAAGASAGGSAVTPASASPDADDRTQMPGQAAPLLLPAASDMGNGLPVGTMLAEFELTALLGEGGFGIVYLARDHSLHRRVALKEYMPSVLAARAGASQVQVKSERHRETFEAGRKSFVNEARLLAQFDHPSLVKVYRFWEANGTAYMVMPFYEGKTLKDLLREMAAPPTEAWLRTLLGPLTEALAVIHREQCYHRDIAPDNVMMLADSQRPLLLDFGAARRVIGDMTQALTVILKPGYAPVEQYAEIPGMKQGPWTDVYALAAVVHYAIVGKTPPPSVGRLLGDSYVPLAQAAAGRYSPGFLAAIDHALAVKPDDRTASIDQLRAELGLGSDVPGRDAGSARPPASAAGAPAQRTSTGATALAGSAVAPRKPGAAIAVAGGAVLLAVLAFGAYTWLSPAARPAAPPVGGAGAPVAVPANGPATPAATTAATTPTAAPATLPGAAPNVLPSPTAAPPLAAGRSSFDVAAEFDRVSQAQTPGFNLQAQATKPQLRIGRDELVFTVQSARDGFLYVQAYGSDGSLTLLYPNTTSGVQKIRKGQTLKLPQPPIVFETTEPVGPTLLLVQVSARERDFSALLPRKEGAYRMLPTGAEAQRIAAALPASPVPAQAGRVICANANANASACDDEFGAAVIRVETIR